MGIFEKIAYYMEFDFVKYALIVGGLISLCCAILGVTLVLKRYASMPLSPKSGICVRLPTKRTGAGKDCLKEMSVLRFSCRRSYLSRKR